MLGKSTKFIVALIGTALMCTFVVGLAYSISTGFAGFWGGLPVSIIVLIVISMAIYDFYEECILGKTWDHHSND